MKKIINSPEELKALTNDELIEQAQLIREFLIKKISKTGGHIGSNLGVVELTMALHYIFDSPTDKLIFDVGHQGYVHKIITGRADKFDTLRQYQGLSGFLKHAESEHDVWEAGHSSTSLSAAAGYAWARDLNNEKNHVVAIIGDGSMTNGMALEALNHLIELNSKVIIIVNDNEMSISNNIGYIDKILKDIQYSSNYMNTKREVYHILKYIPGGKSIGRGISSLKNLIKSKISSSQSFFNLMGFDYIGPVDGHDFSELFKALEHAKKATNSIVIHVKTKKGHGYQPAIDNNWHGVGPFDIETGKPIAVKKGCTYSSLISQHIDTLMAKYSQIVVITPAMLGGSELDHLNEKYPNRVTDVGIAEEHALTFAASLAQAKKIPFVAIYSTFLQRAYDQVFHDICRVNAHVVIGIDRAGLVGDDGETHQGIYDISFLSHMPNMTIVQGKDGIETLELFNYAFGTHNGPIGIRYPRGGAFTYLDIKDELKTINSMEWVVEQNLDSEKVIITYGELVNTALEAFSGKLKVINARFINVLDDKELKKLIGKEVFIVEEHSKYGALASLVALDYPQLNVIPINLKCEFVEQGNVNILKDRYDLTLDKLYNRVMNYGKN